MYESSGHSSCSFSRFVAGEPVSHMGTTRLLSWYIYENNAIDIHGVEPYSGSNFRSSFLCFLIHIGHIRGYIARYTYHITGRLLWVPHTQPAYIVSIDTCSWLCLSYSEGLLSSDRQLFKQNLPRIFHIESSVLQIFSFLFLTPT